MPSHTAQNFKYPLVGLKQAGGESLAKRFLGFNCHADPLKIATKEVTLEKDYAGTAFGMPDLTSFLIALSPDFERKAEKVRARVNDSKGVLLFKRARTGILMYDLDVRVPIDMQETEVVDILTSLSRDGG